MTVSQLAYLEDLIARDALAAAALAELDELTENVSKLRVGAALVERELERAPIEVERRADESREAGANLGAARARLEAALIEVDNARAAGNSERARAAELQVVREQASVRVAEKQAEAADARLRERRVQLAEARAERPRVEQRAVELARLLADRPRLPASVSRAPDGIRCVHGWTVEARAALFLARSAVANERDQAIRQAGELGALVSGHSVSASSMETLAAVIRQASAP